jgi:plasmid maintenance system antidote protein VapI
MVPPRLNLALKEQNMAYAAKRGKNRCPTHPGALLRDDIVPATGRTKAEIAGIWIRMQGAYDTWHAERTEDVSRIPTIRAKAA